MPHLRYLNCVGDDEVWVQPWGRSDRKDRVTVCTHKVRKVIEDLGMWGHYYPKGEARFDEDLARQECLARKNELVTTMLADGPAAIEERKELRLENDRLTQERLAAERRMQAAEKSLKEMVARVPDDVEQALTELRRERDEALEAARKADETLETARRENTGWDWSRFLGGDDED